MNERYYNIVTNEGVKSLPSVTTILQVHNQPALNTWRANLGTELSEQYAEETAAIGKEIHRLVAQLIQNIAIPELEWYQLDQKIKNGVIAYERFKLEYQFEPVGAEQIVYSLKHGYAGTLDAYGKILGKWSIVDWKTGWRFFPNMMAQAAAYYMARKETFNDLSETIYVVNLNREKGVPIVHACKVKDIKPFRNYFLACLRLFKYAQAIKNIKTVYVDVVAEKSKEKQNAERSEISSNST